jgi:hypothetical protein
VELLELMKALKPDMQEHQKMRSIYRSRVQRYVTDQFPLAKLMDQTGELKALTGLELIPEDYNNWAPLTSQWPEGFHDSISMTEQQLWSHIQELMDQWKWYQQAEELSLRDLVTAWRLLEDWRVGRRI